MKKILSLALALAMATTLSTAAFAEDGVGLGDYTANVTATTVDSVEGNDAVFSVDISWPTMDYTYHGEKGPIWDPETHSYSDTAAAYWEGSSTITVTSHSNRTLKALVTYTAEEDYSDAQLQFDTDCLYLDTASNGNEAKSGTITLTPTGSLPNSTSSKTIGTVKLTIESSKLDTIDTISTLTSCHNALNADFYNITSALRDAEISYDVEDLSFPYGPSMATMVERHIHNLNITHRLYALAINAGLSPSIDGSMLI